MNLPPTAILVIAGDPQTRSILRRALPALAPGWAIVVVGTGTEGLAQLAVRAVALVVIDERVPGLPAQQLAHSIMCHAPKTRIVLIGDAPVSVWPVRAVLRPPIVAADLQRIMGALVQGGV